MPETSPPSLNANSIELVSTKDSKITQVSLYPGRAEITRVYRLSLNQGVNQVKISALPTALDRDSLRVEGRGAATIHDVTVAPAEPALATLASEALITLSRHKKHIEKAISRCKGAAAALDSYFHTLTTQSVDAAQLDSIMVTYERENAKLDERLLDLEDQLQNIKEKKMEERMRLEREDIWTSELNLTVTISVFADADGKAEIALIYAVTGANWQASYDIRVNMQAKENPVTLTYKAAISQITGETWENIPLTLETVKPTFGLDLPNLSTCRLSVYKPHIHPIMTSTVPMTINIPPSDRSLRRSRSRSRSPTYRGGRSESDEDDRPRYRQTARKTNMAHATLAVSNFGGLSTTYQVPGLISIPSDGQAHNVTIIKLKLDARFSWITIPRLDARVHLKAKITNASEYTLLPGNANVFVDGSFISKSNLPVVSPQESFDCGLGLDPAIRVTYHPLSQKTSLSGFYNKSTVKNYSQRITVYNTKSVTVDNLKVIDRVPISEDSDITVKLIDPPLTIPSPKVFASSSKAEQILDKGQDKLRDSRSTNKPIPSTPLKVGDGVVAQWDGTDEGTDITALGRDGKLNWFCSVPPQGKMTVSLKWEESWPASLDVTRLRRSDS